MRKLLIALTTLVLVLAVAGCGSSGGSDGADDDGPATTEGADPTTTDASSTDPSTDTTVAPEPVDASRDEYVAALTESLSTGAADEGQLVLERAAAECMAPRWVDAITVEILNEAGVTADELADPGFDVEGLGLELAQGEAMVDAFEACGVDAAALFARALTQGLSAEQQDCAAENADPELVAELLAQAFSTGDSDATFEAVVGQLVEACDLPPA